MQMHLKKKKKEKTQTKQKPTLSNAGLHMKTPRVQMQSTTDPATKKTFKQGNMNLRTFKKLNANPTLMLSRPCL